MATKKDVIIINEKICVSTSALERILGVSRKTFSEWEKKGCPKETRGFWAIEDVLRWRGLVACDGVKTEESTEVKELYRQKLEYEVKWKRAQTENIELKNAISRGDYIQKEEITATLQRLFIVLKRSLLGLSRVISTEIGLKLEVSEARKIENQIHNYIIDALENISINGVFKPKKTKKKLA